MVRDAESQWKGVGGAQLVATQNDVEIGRATADASGSYTMEFGTNISGTCKMSITAEGYKPLNDVFVIKTQWGFENTEFDFSMESSAPVSKPCELYVSVTDSESGNEVTYADVQVSLGTVVIGTDDTSWSGTANVTIDTPEYGSEYTVKVSKEKYITKTTTFTIAEGENSKTVEVALEKDPTASKETVINGSVQDYDSYKTKIKGAVIKLLDTDGTTVLGQTTSGDGGGYTLRIEGMALNGTYEMTCECAGFNKASKEVNLKDGVSVIEVVFAMKVEVATISGNVRNAVTEEVIDGASVTLWKNGSIEKTTIKSSSWSGFTFTLSSVDAGATYEIQAEADGYIGCRKTIQTPEMGKTIEVMIDMQPAIVIQGIVKEYNDGTPIVQATVVLKKGDQTIESAYTDASGEFRFLFDKEDNLPADGTYTLNITADGYLPVSQDVTIDSATSPEFQTISMRMNKVVISGRVSDEKYNDVADADVTLLYGSTEVKAITTDSSGKFTIELREVNDAPYTLRVTKEGFDPYTESLTLRLGDAPWLSIKLVKEGSALDTTEADNSFRISSEGNNVTITLDTIADIMVYSTDGRLAASSLCTTTADFTLGEGVYIVKAGDNVSKISVR